MTETFAPVILHVVRTITAAGNPANENVVSADELGLYLLGYFEMGYRLQATHYLGMNTEIGGVMMLYILILPEFAVGGVALPIELTTEDEDED